MSACPTGCGACCRTAGSLPFLYQHPSLYFEPPPPGWGEGEPEAERWHTAPPEAVAVIKAAYDRGEYDRPERGLPCLWLNEETMQCSWYAWRPDTCRIALKPGDEECDAFRTRYSLPVVSLVK